MKKRVSSASKNICQRHTDTANAQMKLKINYKQVVKLKNICICEQLITVLLYVTYLNNKVMYARRWVQCYKGSRIFIGEVACQESTKTRKSVSKTKEEIAPSRYR